MRLVHVMRPFGQAITDPPTATEEAVLDSAISNQTAPSLSLTYDDPSTWPWWVWALIVGGVVAIAATSRGSKSWR